MGTGYLSLLCEASYGSAALYHGGGRKVCEDRHTADARFVAGISRGPTGRDFHLVEEGSTEREVYIPEGFWKHLFTGQEFEGVQTVNMKAEINEIIVLQKKEAQWEITRDENGEFQMMRR